MKAPVVIVGMGELGGEFARGFLRCGRPVYPVLREMEMERESPQIPEPALVLVTVAEADFDPLVRRLPEAWRNRVALVQNELVPADWERHGLEAVTVAVVWFEKKPGRPLTDVLFTPVYGPRAQLLIEALAKMGVKTRLLEDEKSLLFELMRKSLYILTLNISALAVGGTAGEIWHHHRDLAQAVAGEVMAVLERRVGQSLPHQALLTAMAEGIEDCPERPALGRRASLRLGKVLTEARQAGLNTPTLDRIELTLSASSDNDRGRNPL